jgi:hypothetical protein
VGFLQAWRGDESSLNVCAPPQIDFDDKGQPNNRLSRTTLLISSEYHCNHPSASLANRKLKSLSWYNGQISILFPGVLHIFVECGQDFLSTSEPQRIQDIKSYYSPNLFILFKWLHLLCLVLSCCLHYPHFKVVWHRFHKLQHASLIPHITRLLKPEVKLLTINIERFQDVSHTKRKGDKKTAKVEMLIVTLKLC